MDLGNSYSISKEVVASMWANLNVMHFSVNNNGGNSLWLDLNERIGSQVRNQIKLVL